MKKILLILNESHIANQVIERGLCIAKATGSMIEAVYINDMNGLNYGYPFPNDLYLLEKKIYTESRALESNKLLEDFAQVFRDECKSGNVAYKIDLERSVSVSHLINLSNYADLIIVDSRSDSDEYSLTDILSDAHCPLMLVSRKAQPVEDIILAHDGNCSSFYAIKMFSYIFPEYKDCNTRFVHMAPEDNGSIANLSEIKSWAERHFTNIKFESIRGNPKKDLAAVVTVESAKTLVVMGAYGRSSLSRLLLKSAAESIIKDTDASLFITHQ